MLTSAINEDTAGTATAGPAASHTSTRVAGSGSNGMAVLTGVPFGTAVTSVARLAAALL